MLTYGHPNPIFKEDFPVNQDICFGAITIDCYDAKKLCEFYAKLLSWEKIDIYGKPGVRNGGIMILFVQEDDYVAPVWPERDGNQQKQMHLDFLVSDVPSFRKKAEVLGAVKAKMQYGGTYFTTLIDPAGHPFCLCDNN